MNRIIKIGMDVHSTNYTLCAMEPVLDGEDRIFTNIQVTPDYNNVIQFIDNLKERLGSSDLFIGDLLLYAVNHLTVIVSNIV